MNKLLVLLLTAISLCMVYGAIHSAEVTSTNPQNNQINVDDTTSISATFDTLMSKGTINDTTFIIYSFLSGKNVGYYSLSKDGMTATFDPDSILFPGEMMEAILTTDITSAGGTPLQTPYVWCFTVETADVGDSLYHGPSWISTTLNATCCVALGDYDNDGDLDLACGNAVGGGTGSTTLYRNDGGILTGDPVWNSTVYSTVTRGIAWGDYDGDGDLDLACGNQNDPNMIHRNDSGTLTTSPAWSSNSANTTYGVAWGDYDGDGDLDLVCGNFAQANTLYRNDDGILTADPVWSSTPSNNTTGVAWGDYDNDGDLDLACANYYSDLNTLYRNDGGTLTTDPVWSPLTSAYTTSVAWGDYDGDGDLDLAFGTEWGSAIFRNDAGVLTSTAVWAPLSGRTTYSIAWGDYDGDGDLDLACGNNGQSNTVYRNLGGTLETSAAWLSDSTYYTRGVAWGDLDGDGDLELACGNFEYQPNTVYYNVIVSEPELISTDPVSNANDVLRDANVEATFNEAMASSTIVDTTFIVNSYQSGHLTGIYSMTDNDSTAVFNPDSLFHAGEIIEAVVTTDIESALETPLDEPYVWRFTVGAIDNGDSLYRWPYWLSNTTARAYSSAWGDYDNDGDLDLAFGYIDEPSEVYRNDGGYLTKDPVWTATMADSTLCIAWGDCDGDGDLDLACGNGGKSNTIYRNDNGVLTSNPIWSSTPANDTRDIAWGDYDGDGDLDLVCGNSANFGGDTTNTIYRNDGGLLTTEPVWNSTSTYYTESVAWGDYDGDGDLDLACGNWNGANTLYRNDDGTLTTDPVWSSVEELPTGSVAWGDYDGDGDIDLACGNYNQPNGIYRNDAGTLTSSAAWTSTPNLNTQDIVWGDIDGDGDLDLVCGNFGEANVIYFNEGGSIATNPTWGTSVTYMTIGITLGDVDGDGDLEIACANYFNEPNTVYYRTTVPAPALVSTDPVVNSLNVSRDENVQATFNQKMDLASFTDTSFVVQSFQTGQLAGTYSMANSETTAVFDPDLLLHAGEVVEATLTDGIKSRVGTNLNPHYVWRFTVESINNGDSLNVDAVWLSERFYYTRCVAWGDVDNDGDLDLACANRQDDEPTTIYRNDSGILTDEPVDYVDPALRPYSIAWGDFNGDGYPDLALGNYYSQSNTVHLNYNGYISAYGDWNSNPTNNTTSVACGDYDRDGDLDLAFGNIGASNTVYRNDGGTFTADPVWTSTPVCSTQSVAWGDYDNDGDLDLICANSGAGETCNLYRNDGGWLTGNPVWSGPASRVTYSISWGDYDSDGFVDLACGNYGGQNRIYHNDVGSGFTESWVSTPSYYTNSVSWVDYDGDGDLDLSCCNRGQPEVIYRNDTGVLNSDPVCITSEDYYATDSFDWGDFDGDGDLDLAVGMNAYRSNKVYRSGFAVHSTAPASNALDIDLSMDMEAQFTYALNPPTVSSSSFTAYGYLSGAMTGSISTHSGDLYAVLDPDSVFHTGEVVEVILTDAVASSTGESLVHSHVWRFNIEVPAADSLLPQAVKSLTINDPYAIAWGDYDRDGDLDLACAAFDVVLYRNDGGVLSMTPVWSVNPPDPRDIAWGDYDRDGDLDLACANRTMTGAYNTLYRNDGDSLTSDPVWTSSDISQTIAIAWGDCNGDGYLDLAFVNESGVISMGIYFNVEGTLSEDPFYGVFPSSGNRKDVAWGDYDNDGDLDLATAAYAGRNFLYRNEGGTFYKYHNEIWMSQPSNNSRCVAWGDYDGDGDLDLAFANEGQSNTVYENDGGTLTDYPEWSSVPINYSYCVEWIDYDGDGDLDLAFGNYDQPNTIYLNENSRLKTTPTWSSAPSNKTGGMNCGDFDGDGDMDLAFSNYWDNSIVIYLNKDIWAPS
ncbi:MAG: VCBS repeat-containing protein, partial [bacterium]